MKLDTVGVKPEEFVASGMRWKNAPPSRPPAERLTMYRSILLFNSLLKIRVIIPAKDRALTRVTLRREYIQTSSTLLT